MASLANQTISSTYDGLVKTSTDQPVPISGVQLLEDGVGNSLALSVGRANQGVTITGTATATAFSGPLTGNVTGNLTGTVLTAAQTNITSVGTLSSLAVSGNLTVDTNTLFVDAASNRVGVGNTPADWNLSGLIPFQVGNAGLYSYLSEETGFTNNAYFNSGWKYISSARASKYVQTQGNHIWYSSTVGTVGAALSETEAMRIDASGNLGIGTSSPTAKLHSFSTDSTYALTAENTLSGADQNFILFRAGANIGDINRPSGTNNLEINANFGSIAFGTDTAGTASERMRIDSSGYLRLAGAGIQFNGDTAAANALDDYEEGTWTPNIIGTGSGAAALGQAEGIYTKIGRQVFCNFVISFTKNTLSGGTLQMAGFPFTSIALSECAILIDTLATTLDNPLLQINGSVADFIQGNGSTGIHAGLSIDTYLSASPMRVRGTMTYFV